MTAIDAPAAALPAPGYPVRVTVADEPAPGRARVFFRLLLAIPHLMSDGLRP